MVGLLIITHNNVGDALFDAAISVLGSCPLPFEILPVSQNCDPEERIQLAQTYIATGYDEDSLPFDERKQRRPVLPVEHENRRRILPEYCYATHSTRTTRFAT